MPSYKFTHFNAEGAGDVTRYLFALGDVKYEDIKLDREQWKKMKESKSTPFGQLPVLEVDGEVLCQSRAIESFVAKLVGRAGKNDMEQAKCLMVVECVVDTIKPLMKTMAIEDEAEKTAMRKAYAAKEIHDYLPRFEKMLESSKSGYFVGDQITWADVTLFWFLEASIKYSFEFDNSKYPKLKKLHEQVKADKKIAAWQAKRA